MGFKFEITHKLDGAPLARAGIITTPHGKIETPAFIVVGTKAAVKAMVPEQVKAVGAQAVLANAYHLYLQPGPEILQKAGGLGKFMNWPGPTFTDSGGFQVLSLGSGYKKVLAMDSAIEEDKVIAKTKSRHAFVDNDGVNFKSHLNGSMHRFTPEFSMQVQSAIGADITFAFDELTALQDSYEYQVESLRTRTHPWAKRSLAEVQRLRNENPDKPYQALFGVIQGAQYKDLREEAATFMG
ncbi:tRNA-guanine transglycosylase, partial [Candidatus Saccharibacteria bacterium]|nr:tRNA-guanine transglycosylase [Candidatus Saccharibacteria bacterium]